MNKIIKDLLIIALVLSTQRAKSYTNKTFLQPRNQALVNLPYETTSLQNRVVGRFENRFGRHLQALVFYGVNTNRADIGRYYGANTNTMNIIQTGKITNDMSDLNTTPGTLDIGYIIHDFVQAGKEPTPANTNLIGTPTTISLNPKSTYYGIDFAYFQDLSKICKGLYLTVKFPIERVENDPALNVSGGYANAALGNATQSNIYAYFAGKYTSNSQDTNNLGNVQTQLTAGKIAGKRSATGIADIDVLLGYNLLNKKKGSVIVNIGVSIPTGNTPTGEYLFEPVYGTQNFGLGCGMEAEAYLWGCENHNLKMNIKANYRSLFQGSESRIFGIRDDQWGQYELLASQGLLPTTSVLTPAANILKQKCYVTLGSQFDSILGFAYNKRLLRIDFGYNLYFRESESVEAKGTIPPIVYVTAARGLDISNNKVNGDNAGRFTENEGIADNYLNAKPPDDTDSIPGAAYISQANINSNAASTPSQFTNGVYIGLGYTLKNFEHPIVLGIGGKYEFALKNSVLEVWQGWIKASINF